MRVLVVSTPRSGNTWFRRLLSGLLNLQEFAIHRPTDLNWEKVPINSIVQMHWRVRPDVLSICRDFEFQPVVIVRHPLDVLISVLHFCTYEPDTRCWLDGEAGDESSIWGKDPTDPAFAAYATSARAAALLASSAEWVGRQTPFVRYEDLVARTHSEMGEFLRGLSAEPVCPLPAVIDANTLIKSQAADTNHHFWQGRPGIWREVTGRDLACRIQQAHAGVFESLGYGIDLSLIHI